MRAMNSGRETSATRTKGGCQYCSLPTEVARYKRYGTERGACRGSVGQQRARSMEGRPGCVFKGRTPRPQGAGKFQLLSIIPLLFEHSRKMPSLYLLPRF
jgi:hypothetical protein